MKRFSLTVALATFVVFGTLPAFAQRGARGGGGGFGGAGVGQSRGSDIGGTRAGESRGDRSTIDRDRDTHATRIDAKKSPDQMLSRHPKLESKLASLLPHGTNVQQAASGFKNLGQFVAAVHVSHNTGIPFDGLKSKMTGPHAESLGKAIHDLKPDADSKAEVKKAEQETKQDLEDSTDTDKA